MPKKKFTFELDDDELADAFDFDVKFVISGSNPGKEIQTGAGTVITTSPGWKMTMLADQDGDGEFEEIYSSNINGTTKRDVLDDGTQEFAYNGHNLIVDGQGFGDPGEAWYKLTTGHFEWTGDAEFNTREDLDGHGQVVDLGDFFG